MLAQAFGAVRVLRMNKKMSSGWPAAAGPVAGQQQPAAVHRQTAAFAASELKPSLLFTQALSAKARCCDNSLQVASGALCWKYKWSHPNYPETCWLTTHSFHSRAVMRGDPSTLHPAHLRAPNHLLD